MTFVGHDDDGGDDEGEEGVDADAGAGVGVGEDGRGCEDEDAGLHMADADDGGATYRVRDDPSSWYRRIQRPLRLLSYHHTPRCPRPLPHRLGHSTLWPSQVEIRRRVLDLFGPQTA